MSFVSKPYNPPAQSELEIVYEDKQLLIVNKLPGLLTVPGRGIERQDCLISRVQKLIPQALIVHRLDMATSGLVLLAKNKSMQRELSLLFQKRAIKKHYSAVVANIPEAVYGLIDLPLIVDWPNKPLQKVDWLCGKPSRTYYQVIASDSATNTARLKVEPITGRTHQIRLHLQAIGYPIVGDQLYAPESIKQQADRLLLHASQLAFIHPTTGKSICLHVCPNF